MPRDRWNPNQGVSRAETSKHSDSIAERFCARSLKWRKQMNPGDFDLSDPDLYVSKVPHEIFTWLRREDPVHWNPEAEGRGFWSVTKYDDIVAISKNPQIFSSAREH